MLMVGDGFMTSIDRHWGIGATYEQKPWDEARATEFNLAAIPRVVARADAAQIRCCRCVARLRGSRAVDVGSDAGDRHACSTPPARQYRGCW